MGSFENVDWDFDGASIADVVAGVDFLAPETGGFYWTPQGLNAQSNAPVQIDGASYLASDDVQESGSRKLVQIDGASYLALDDIQESGSRKRVRPESSSGSGSKACKEKMRRDRLNDRFLELASTLEPGKPPKMDKAAILNDAIRMVNELRNEAQKLKDANKSLQEKTNELKAKKNKLRDEKQRLKIEKESLEQQVKLLSARTSFMPHPPVMPTTFAPQGQVAGHKLVMPVIGYPGFPMWQFMPPADVDTSQDVESCPPVA